MQHQQEVSAQAPVRHGTGSACLLAVLHPDGGPRTKEDGGTVLVAFGFGKGGLHLTEVLVLPSDPVPRDLLDEGYMSYS